MKWQIFTADTFDNYEKQWDDLNFSGPNSPVLNSSFIKHSLKEFGTGKEILGTYGNDDSIVAMTVLTKPKFGLWDTFQPSQAPLGFWLNNSGEDTALLLKSLSKELPGIVLKVGLTQQDPDIYPRPESSNSLSTMDYIDTARISNNVPFEEYWAARGKNLRHNLKRQRNRLKKEGIE
ncbi:MAG: GNAT family N-acetyltransferase, partial [Sedimenticola sp.]|nr:GNAT family N-acetyltransferase [Sedimenticola sp.]